MLTIAEYMDGRRTERKDVRLPCERDQVAATLEPSRPIIDCLPSRLEAPLVPRRCLGSGSHGRPRASAQIANQQRIGKLPKHPYDNVVSANKQADKGQWDCAHSSCTREVPPRFGLSPIRHTAPAKK